MTAILGLSAYYHDSAACLVVDGDIVAAAQEERFTRRKHDHRFPARAIAWCLREGGLRASDLDYVGFYDKPLVKFERLLETYLDSAPRGLASFLAAMPLWLKEKLWLPDLVRRELAAVEAPDDPRAAKRLARSFRYRLLFADHHESHAASAFYPSPYEEAAILTLDGVGEWATASVGVGRGREITLLEQLRFPHSLGLLYSAFTYFTGFRVNSGEYKVMGLAPYGRPRYVDLIKERLLDLRDDGSFRLRQEYFTYCPGLRMTGRRFAALFSGPERVPESPLTDREMDLARSVQTVTEEVVLRMAAHAHRLTGQRYLVMAGGVALNCVANGRLLREGPFDDLWVQPAAGDAGGALGVALGIWHRYLGRARRSPEREGRWVAPTRPVAEAPGSDAASERVPTDDGPEALAAAPPADRDGLAAAGAASARSPALTAGPLRTASTDPQTGREPNGSVLTASAPVAVSAHHGGGAGGRRELPPYADGMKGSFLGPRFSPEAIVRWLDARGLPYERVPQADLPARVAGLIATEQVVGLFQGRMEFGPRALGARSIVADARSPRMQAVLNLKIKFRESFRPFAPSVLAEHVADWFELDRDSPYMLLVADVVSRRRRAMTDEERSRWGIDLLNVPRSEVPAVTHVDYSARIQTVRRDVAPLYYDIIATFHALTGCPVIVNTSFNVRGEPIVCTPEDAYRCFMRTDMDALVLEECVLLKSRQPPFTDAGDWQREFPLD
ncbi:MAG: carbamoyltransferase [Armatimonadota bacterium]|nr:carbamoyltransferase [Armatimonadota bacterium]